MVRAVEVQTLGFTGKGVTVAVIDSGVDSAHPDLVSAVIDEACFCLNAQGAPCCPNGSSKQTGPGAARDDNGHGTHIAGVIAGRGHLAPLGLAPDANVVAVRVTDAAGATLSSSMLSAIDWILSAHPEVKVINMSLGTLATYTGVCDGASSITGSFASVGRTLRARNVVLVASSGNDAKPEQMMAPACVSTTLSVGAVYSQNESGTSYAVCSDAVAAADHVTCFSNSSASLSVLAPGTGIVSSSPSAGLAIGSGTSQAAAVTSGAVAILMEAAGATSGPRVEAALKAAGVPVRDPRNGRESPRIDAAAALLNLSGR